MGIMVMVNTSSSLAAFFILSGSGSSPTSAFVQVGVGPARQRTSLHATEAFQRSLLAERLGTTNGVGGGDAPLPSQDHEKFQRSLLEAKLAYDAVDAALSTTATPAVDVAEEEPVIPVEEVAAVVVMAESEPEPDPAVPVPKPEPAVVAAATTSPEPEIPKPIVPTPTSEPVKPKRAVKPTEFTVPRTLAIVPINEATVQFTAGAVGAAAGLVLGGPILAAVSASVFNYLSRKDDDAAAASSENNAKTSPKKIVDTASQTVLLAYNFLAQFEKNNRIFDSTFKLLEGVVDKAKETDSPAGDALVAVESTLGGIVSKVEELNDDYDLVGGAGTLLDSVGDLVEIGVDKAVDLNDEYKLTDRVGDVVKGAVDKVTVK